MVVLNSLSITKTTRILASALPDNSATSHLHVNSKSSVPKINVANPISEPQQPQQLRQKLKGKQPSVAEIERAIGAGIFRDRDTHSDAEQSKTLFDTLLSNSIAPNEGSVEKKLRETGEWIIDKTERTSRSAGKQILMTVFIWVLPMWIFAFLVASGFVVLPFSTPFLDDLIL